MGYADFTDGAVLPASSMDELSKQVILKYATAAARDADAALTAALREGMFAYLDNTNTLTVYTGSTWTTVGPVHGALTSFTPVVTQSSAVGKTVNYCKYQRVGRLVWYQGLVTVTSPDGVGANAIGVELPTTAASATTLVVGTGRIYDTSAALYWPGPAIIPTTTAFSIASGSVGGPAGLYGAAGFTAALTTGDEILWSIMYEASSD